MKKRLITRASRSSAAAAFVALLVFGTVAPWACGTILPAPTVTNSAPPFNASFSATNVVENTEAEYASASQGVNTFLDFSFGSPQTFDKIVVVNRNSAGQSDYIGNFTLTLDGATTASVTRTPMRGSSEVHSLGRLITATTIHLQVDTIGTGDTFNNTGAMEVLFVRTPTGQTPISASIFGAAQAFGTFFSSDNAVDGIVGRSSAASGDGPEYASASLGSDAFVDFDLGALRFVGGFDFFDRIADEDRITAFNLIFSVNTTFGDADDVLKSYTKSTIGSSDVFSALTARYVRFDVTANLGGPAANTGISEIIFYQVPEPSVAALFAVGIAAAMKRRRQ